MPQHRPLLINLWTSNSAANVRTVESDSGISSKGDVWDAIEVGRVVGKVWSAGVVRGREVRMLLLLLLLNSQACRCCKHWAMTKLVEHGPQVMDADRGGVTWLG